MKFVLTLFLCAFSAIGQITTGGDLSGTLPAPTVARIQGRAVSSAAPTDGDSLLWNGTVSQWAPGKIGPSNITPGSDGYCMKTSGSVVIWGTCGGTGTSQWTTSGSAIWYTSGNVLIGTSTDSGYRLDIIGNSRISGTLSVSGAITGSITGNAASVTNGVYTTGSYSDPSWLNLTKSKVGLSNVENTALSTWAGSSNITTIGTLAAGAVPWARLLNIPGVSAFTNDAGYLTASSLSNYANKTTANSFTAGAKQTMSQSASTAGLNLGALSTDPSSPANGDIWINAGAMKLRQSAATKTVAYTDSSITGTAANVTGTVAVANGGTGQTTLASAYAAFVNSQPHQINFVYGGSASSSIGNTTVNNVWRAHAYTATISEVACWTDAGTVTLAIKDSAGNMVTSSTLACSSTGASTASMNTTYNSITSGEGLGFTTSSASGVKNLSVSIKYTRAY